MQSNSGLRAAPLRRASLAFVGAMVLVVAGCEVPAMPEWDVGVVAPFSSDPIAIVDFLPSEVDTATANGQSVFTLQPRLEAASYTLGEMCPLCLASQGSVEPVPGYDYTDSLDVPFDARLLAAEVIGVQLSFAVANGMNFDPLRPHADPDSAGFIEFTVRDLGSGTELQTLRVEGSSQSLPPGDTLYTNLAISNVTISQGLRVAFQVHSPQDGQTVRIDSNLSAGFAALLDTTFISAVTVVVDGEALDETFFVDFEENARAEIAERVQSASYELQLIHNATVDGPLEVSIAEAEADLFSGDPTREVRLQQLALTPGIVQTGSLTIEEIDLIGAFLDIYVGYRAVGYGTGVGPQGQPNASRFTADTFLESRLKVTSVIRVGE